MPQGRGALLEPIFIVLLGLCYGTAVIFCMAHHSCIRLPGEPLHKWDILCHALAAASGASILGAGVLYWLRHHARPQTEGPVVRAGRSPGLSLQTLRARTALGVAFYALAAGMDAFMTMTGLSGDPGLEGNAFLRALMAAIGIQPALALAKISAGLALWFVAARIGRAIHDEESWIEKIPTLPPLRRWLRSGDRCWVALVPLYCVAASQAFAACAWLWLRYQR